MKKRLTTNAVIRFLNDNPQVFVIRLKDGSRWVDGEGRAV
jgi:hypothetical protein